MAGSGYKQYKGQLQTYPGSATGEPIIVNNFDYNSNGMPLYIGEAKYGTRDIENKWYLTKYNYDAFLNVTSTGTAINQCITGATAVTVDASSNPGFARIQLVSGDISLVSVGDILYLKTATNYFGGNTVKQILSATEILIDTVPATNETATPITDQTTITFALVDDTLKNFDKRRWDKRSLYIYQ